MHGFLGDLAVNKRMIAGVMILLRLVWKEMFDCLKSVN